MSEILNDYLGPQYPPDPICPICFELLFDEKGVCHKEGGVADIVCRHLVHDTCLNQQAGSSPGPSRQSILDRTFCPTCERPVSCWPSSAEFASFAIFWLPKIEHALKKESPPPSEGGGGGVVAGVPIERIKACLRKSNALTEQQKAHLDRPDSMTSGAFEGAISWGGSVEHGANADSYYHPQAFSRGLWTELPGRTLWLTEWGTPPGTKCATCDRETSDASPLMVCSGCKDSVEAVYYCDERCQSRDWEWHKGQCKKYRELRKTYK